MSFKLARVAGICAALATTPALAQDLHAEIALLKAHIAALEARLDQMEQQKVAPPPATQAQAAPAAPAPAATQAGAATAFNPEIGVVLDGRYGAFGKDPAAYTLPGFARGDAANPSLRGFALGESEIAMSSNIDQWLYGAAVISFERDGAVGVEEAYIQSTSLPWGFTAKAGRFFAGFGYLNAQHKHTWDFADAPLAYLAFLNEQYGDDGMELRWLAPADVFLELGGALARGDAFPAGGAANRGVGAWNVFAHAGDDLNEASNFRVGAGFLRTLAHDRATDDAAANLYTGYSNTGIVDAVYKWAPGGNATETTLKLQAEYFVREERGAFTTIPYVGHQHGWYAQAVYQFMPRWRFGLRYDRVYAESLDRQLAGSALDNMGHAPTRYSAMLDYSTSEFGRFRLQLNRDESRPTDIDNQVLLQYTVSFGTHPAHNY